MKISSNSLPPAQLNSSTTPASPRRVGLGGANSAASDATSLGSSLVGLSAQALAQPELRSNLVAHFRGQLAQGSYHPDAGATAARMLADPLIDL